MTDGRVLSDSELRDAYDHACEFLAEDVTLHNLTNIERATCHSLVGMYRTIRDLQRQVSELTEWIEDMQWSASASWYESNHCPYCESYKDKGHKSDCELGNFLAKHAPRQEDAK